MKRFLLFVLAASLVSSGPVYAQSQTITFGNVVASCGTTNGGSYTTGQDRPVTQDTTGKLCSGAAVSGTVTTTPGQRTLVTLDIKTVTTGGTAVNAISAGHRTAGGFLQNPIGATIALCINEIGTASGTTSSGDTTCIQPGQAYTVAPAASAVSVVTSDSSHPFSGYGMN